MDDQRDDFPRDSSHQQDLDELDQMPIADGYHAVWCMVRQWARERKLKPSEVMTLFNVGQVAASQLWPADRLAFKERWPDYLAARPEGT